MRKIEINSLQEYISEIEKLKDSYFFRGEPAIYQDIRASAFRRHKVPYSVKENLVDYQKG